MFYSHREQKLVFKVFTALIRTASNQFGARAFVAPFKMQLNLFEKAK